MKLPMARNGLTMHLFIGLFLVLFLRGVRSEATTVDCHLGSNIWPEGQSNADTPCATCVVTPADAKFTIDDMNTFTFDPDPPVAGTYSIYFSSTITTDYETQDSYSTTARASAPDYTDSSSQLLVIITDVNDNPPIYETSTVTKSIVENHVEDAVVILSVTDGDGTDEFSANSLVYEFANSQGDYGGTFTLTTNYDADSKTSSVSINVAKELDYEELISYNLNITVKDNNGNPDYLSNSATVVIDVQDEEDTDPYFTTIASSTKISEDAAVGSPVLSVTAADGDKGINNPIVYSIVAGNDDNSFAIDENSGSVTVNSALDRDNSESAGLYTITIMATETSSDSASTTTECTISVLDVDDSAPTFAAGPYTASVPENSPNDFFVSFEGNAYLTVTDADLGDNAKFTVALSDPNSLFDITPKEGQSQTIFSIIVTNSAGLDYETIQSTDVTATAIDTNNPDLSSTAVIHIDITDQNDNSPEIASVDCDPIPENAPPGTHVCTVTATDGDLSPPANSIQYSASFGQLEGSLEINSDTGEITVLSNDDNAFDFERTPYYIITVMARDNGGAGEMDSESVTLDITDVNDSPPQFQQDTYQASLNENEDGFYVSFVVQATDADSMEVNGGITFKIISDDPVYFDVITNTTVDNLYAGTIFPISPIDFEVACASSETSCKLQFQVQVVDESNTALSDTAQVAVTLMDTNDNAPQFDPAGIYYATIPENAAIGTSVVTVSASDGDLTPKYSTITYRLENDMAPNFAIDPKSGVITVAEGAVLDPDSFGTGNEKYIYNLVVVADDGGSRETPSEQYVNVTISDVNNKPPAFTSNGFYSTEVDENASGVLFTVSATDLDSDSDLVYSIDSSTTVINDQNGSPTDAYAIEDYLEFADSRNGDITYKKSLDRETMLSIVLGLKVVDENTVDGVDSATGTLTITINDVNDIAPEFQNSPYYGTVMEATSKAVVTMQDYSVSATDGDTDAVNKAVTYSIVSVDPPDSDITIDSHTGYLITGETGLDYETSTLVTVTIQATDGGDPPLTSPTNAVATINVTSKDEFAPEFDPVTYEFNVTENSYTFDQEAKVYATDDDAGEDGEIGYELQDDYGAFAIDDNGVITLTNPLDYDRGTTKYILTVYAIDHPDNDRSTHLSGNAQVTVNVNPLNDEPPYITDLPEIVSVSESNFDEEGADHLIYTVTATDADAGELDSKLVFDLQTYNDFFEIDPDTGDVHVSGSLLNNDTNYILNVEVCDSGIDPGPLCMNSTLTVRVVDANNNAPYITGPENKDKTIPEHDDNNPDVTPTDEDVTLFTITFTDDDTNTDFQLTDPSLVTTCIGAGGNSAVGIFQLRPEGGDPFPNLILYYHGLVSREDCSKYQFTVTLTNREPSYDDSVLSTSAIFTLTVSDVDAFPPQFPQQEFNGSIVENVVGFELLLPRPFDPDIEEGDAPEEIWCEILSIDPHSDAITVKTDGTDCTLVTVIELDHEKENHYDILVHAIENKTGVLPDDVPTSQLYVGVEVGDVNDNPPYFDDAMYYSGVSSDTAMSSVILTLVGNDDDTVVDATTLTYKMGVDGATVHDDSGTMNGVPNDCLLLHTDGNVISNFGFLDTMQGYLEFTANVYDSSIGKEDQYTGTTTVKVNVVSQTQKIECSSMIPPGDFPDHSQQFTKDFSAVLNQNVDNNLKDDSHTYIVVYDTVRPHMDGDVTVVQQSDIFIHLLEDNEVLEAEDAMSVINKHSDVLYTTVFQTYSIYYIGAVVPYSTDDGYGVEFYILIAIACLLLITCIVILGLCIYRNSALSRKLRAVQATSFGSNASSLNRVGINPIHKGFEGSNPVYKMDIDVDDHQYDDTSDVSDSLESIKNESDFSGGVNNPDFEQRIENIFADDNVKKGSGFSTNKYDDDFGDKFSLPENGEPESGFESNSTIPIGSSEFDHVQTNDNGSYQESTSYDDTERAFPESEFKMPEETEADFENHFDFLQEEKVDGEDLY